MKSVSLKIKNALQSLKLKTNVEFPYYSNLSILPYNLSYILKPKILTFRWKKTPSKKHVGNAKSNARKGALPKNVPYYSLLCSIKTAAKA